MNRRCADWSPLDYSSDPVPGDPEGVKDKADTYLKTAQEIEQQARLLRALSRAEGWDSDAGRVFAEEAGELAGKLDKTHGRYSAVNTQLRKWAPALTEAQEAADEALDKATEALATKQANSTSLLTGVTDPTPEQKEAEKDRKELVSGADAAISAAKKALAKALDTLDDVAGQVSKAIKDASDDDVKDGFWDKVKGFVSDHAGIIDFIANAASWIALGVAVLALVIGAPFTLLILGLTAIALVLKTALAASGEGSWLDVGVEAFSLATLGLGAVITKGAKVGVALTRGAAARHAASKASNAVLHSNRYALSGLRWVKTTRFPLGPLRGLARAQTARIAGKAERAGSAAAQAVRRTPLARAGLRTRLRYLDDELANYATDVRRMAKDFPTSPEVAANVARTMKAVRDGRAVAGAGYVVDITDKMGGFNPLKPHFMWEFRPMRW